MNWDTAGKPTTSSSGNWPSSSTATTTSSPKADRPGGGFENVGDGDTYGFEYNATCQISPTWHLTGSYSFLIECIEYPGSDSSMTSGNHSAGINSIIQSGWDLGHDVTFDLMFRYVDSLSIGVREVFCRRRSPRLAADQASGTVGRRAKPL